MTDRETILREIAKKQVRYQVPGMDSLVEPRQLAYRGDLLMDVYAPTLASGHRAPIVMILTGYPDPENKVLSYGPFTSWARLIAASGMAAVLLGTRSPIDDTDAAIAYVRAHPGALGVDAQRLGLFATSGSVPLALSMLMREPALACAALMYGYTMDLDSSTIVAGMAAQFGFVNACAGRTVDDLPAGVPLLFVRAGHDRFPGVNDALDAVVRRALARNLPLTLINHATGAHGFDCDEDSDISREIIRQALAFLRVHLKA